MIHLTFGRNGPKARYKGCLSTSAFPRVDTVSLQTELVMDLVKAGREIEIETGYSTDLNSQVTTGHDIESEVGL